jgi:hypothetical protein
VRALVLLGALIVMTPAASGGIYFPPPGDSAPMWSPDGRRIAFVSHRLRGLAVVEANGSGGSRVFDNPVVPRALSPDWTKVAYVSSTSNAAELHVRAIDGTQARKLAERVSGFAWAPDSDRLAFVQANTIFVVDSDGGNPKQIAAPAAGAPVWSPDGTRVAFLRTQSDQSPDLYVVNADGSGEANLTNDAAWNADPQWSPNGRALAFVSRNDRQTRLEIVDIAGTDRRSFPAGQVNEFGWMADGTRIWVAADGILSAIDVASRQAKRLSRLAFPPGGGLTWSPDGTRFAFAAGGECRDRVGIYVAEPDAAAARRITNDCRIVGTEGDDELHGTALADVLAGLAGNDRLFAEDPGYMGDTLEGGSGADRLTGDYQRDTLEGGSGADVIRGGPSGDLLDGGYGRDRLDGEGGRDVILARDGERDVIVCGTNQPGTPELDTVTVDYFDAVARDCEVVNGKRVKGRARTTSLTILVWPQGMRGAARAVRWTLACQPARGTLPAAAKACRRLLRQQRPFRAVPRGIACTEIYGGPEEAEVRGRLRGRRVASRFSRTDGCQIERWNRVSFLFRT